MSAARGLPDADVVGGELGCTLVSKCCELPEFCWPMGKCKRDVDGYMKTSRKRDVAAMRRKLLMVRECYSCGHPASDGHHIVFRSHGGDDVEENIAPLCHQCHEILHKDTGEDADVVCRQIGESLVASEHGEIEYILRKLGVDAGQFYLSERYHCGAPAALTKRLRREGVAKHVSPLGIIDLNREET